MSETNPLTTMQLDLIRRTADGKSMKVIAHEAGMTIMAVQWQIRRAMQTIGIHTIAGLVAKALREGWIE